MTTLDLMKVLGIESKDLQYNLKYLKKKGYTHTEQVFVDGSLKTVIIANPKAITNFQHMRDMLMDFLSSSPNMEKYIESVLEIKNQENVDD